jgi:hypothetical protein
MSGTVAAWVSQFNIEIFTGKQVQFVFNGGGSDGFWR